jgi:penicillin-binding protein 1A
LVLTDIDVKTLYGKSIPDSHVITPQTAYLMVNLLKGVVEGGTGTRLLALGRPNGGKTGTTNDETDTWFLSIMPDLVSGVWVGFDQIKKIGHGATGGNTAAPIVLEYLKIVTKDKEPQDFTPPEGFPTGSIASLTGGSLVEGIRPSLTLPGEFGGEDYAGEFFEEDMEFSGENAKPEPGWNSYKARSSHVEPKRGDDRSYPDF